MGLHQWLLPPQEFIAVSKLNKSVQGKILCFVGPPGELAIVNRVCWSVMDWLYHGMVCEGEGESMFIEYYKYWVCED